jgi:hypothetical protein
MTMSKKIKLDCNPETYIAREDLMKGDFVVVLADGGVRRLRYDDFPVKENNLKQVLRNTASGATTNVATPATIFSIQGENDNA